VGLGHDQGTRPKLTVRGVQDATGSIEDFAHNCHGASLILVRSGLVPDVY
jgi:hypothetical protein